MTIRIENYREANPADKHLAIFDVYLPKISLVFRNMKLVKAKSGKEFLSYPSFVVSEDEYGKKTFAKTFEFSEEKTKEFETQVYEELTPFLGRSVNRFTR